MGSAISESTMIGEIIVGSGTFSLVWKKNVIYTLAIEAEVFVIIVNLWQSKYGVRHKQSLFSQEYDYDA